MRSIPTPASHVATRLRYALQLAMVAALIGSPGCSGGTLQQAPTPTDRTETELFSFIITTNSHSVGVGSGLQLQTAGINDASDPLNVIVNKWSSSNLAIATVSSTGVVSGVKAGSVTITADTNNPPREATIMLRVLGAGETPPPEPTGGSTVASVALPNASPIVGTYIPPDGSGDLPATPVTQSPPPGQTIAIYPTSPRVAAGERLRLVASDAQGASTGAAWQTSDTTVATVDEAGNVTGVRPGTVTITASSLAYPTLAQTAQLLVVQTVSSDQIVGIRISPSKVSLNIGQTAWAEADIPTTNGSFDSHVKWEIGDTSVATISEIGEITGVGPGSTIATATATGYSLGDLSASIPVTVKNVSAAN